MVGTGAFLVALVVCLLILHFLKQLHSSRRYPPGPLPLPIIGGLWRLVTAVNPHSLIKLAEQYGNVYTLWLGNMPVVVLSGFEAMKEGLINHSECFVNRPGTPFIKVVFQDKGIVFSNGHTWKQQRWFGQVTMRKLGLGKKGLELHIEEEAQELVETFARAKGQPLDPSLPIVNSVCNVISALAFGHRFSVEDEEFKNLVEKLDISFQFGNTVSYVLFEVFPWLMKRLPGPHKKAFAAIERIITFARKEIEQHKEYHCLHEPQDYIDFYILQMEKSKDDHNSTYDEDNLAHCIFELFAAGTETTSTTLKWALLLMAINPDIQDRVRKEMKDIFGPSHAICYQDRKKLPYTNAVIHEIQRAKYVLFYGLSRQCLKDVNLLGCFIPQGAIIVPNLRSVLLDPKRWETPEEFNPNHFLDEEEHFVYREEFLPFGAGHRACLGENLARIELFIFFTSLLRAFIFQLPKGVNKVNQEPLIGTTTPPRPFKLCCIPHSC